MSATCWSTAIRSRADRLVVRTAHRWSSPVLLRLVVSQVRRRWSEEHWLCMADLTAPGVPQPRRYVACAAVAFPRTTASGPALTPHQASVTERTNISSSPTLRVK